MTNTKRNNGNKTLQINMAVAASVAIDTADQDAILASMLDEIIEEEGGEVVAEEHELTATIADIEKAEAIEALYDVDATDAIVSEADAPKTDADVATKKGKAKAPKEPKAPRVTSVTHRAGDLLLAKLGENAKDFLVFEVNDAALDATALDEKTEAFIARMNVLDKDSDDYIADKVRDKAIQLFGFIKNGGVLNKVMRLNFEALIRDGELTSGNKGNSQTALLSVPLSAGTSASQSNQIFMLFPLLNITKREKGRMLANPDSLILMKMQAELGLA